MRTLEFPIAKKTKLYIRGGYVAVGALILSILLMVLTIWFGGWCFVIGSVMFLLVYLANALVVVESEDTAYATVLGRSPKHSIMNGLHCVWPFITNVVMLETRPTEYQHIEKNINMPQGIPVEADCTISYELIDKQVYMFARQRPPFEKAFPSALKTALRAILTSYSCDELLDENSATSATTTKVALKEEIRLEIGKKFIEVLEESYYKYGVDELFVSLSLSAMNIDFPEGYLNERMEAVKAQQKAKAAEALKKAQITEAEAVAESTKIIAKADSEAIELKGGAENRVLKRKGEILEKHGSISENDAANHLPQSFVIGGGGITPVMDVVKELYPHKGKDDSSTTTTPTPPTP